MSQTDVIGNYDSGSNDMENIEFLRSFKYIDMLLLHNISP